MVLLKATDLLNLKSKISKGTFGCGLSNALLNLCVMNSKMFGFNTLNQFI